MTASNSIAASKRHAVPERSMFVPEGAPADKPPALSAAAVTGRHHQTSAEASASAVESRSSASGVGGRPNRNQRG